MVKEIPELVSSAAPTAPLTFYGRTFSVAELELMQKTVAEFAALGVTEISSRRKRSPFAMAAWRH